MGWDSRLTRYGEKVDMAKEVAERYTWDNAEPLKVVRGKQRHGETPYYVAVRNQAGEVWAGVALTKRTKTEVWMKTMDETCGPGSHDAQAAKILDLLTPTDSEWANEWREAVRAAAVAEATQPKVAVGDVLKFAEGIDFGWAGVFDELRFEGRNKFTDPNGYKRFRVANWKTRKFEIIKIAA